MKQYQERKHDGRVITVYDFSDEPMKPEPPVLAPVVPLFVQKVNKPKEGRNGKT